MQGESTPKLPNRLLSVATRGKAITMVRNAPGVLICGDTSYHTRSESGPGVHLSLDHLLSTFLPYICQSRKAMFAQAMTSYQVSKSSMIIRLRTRLTVSWNPGHRHEQVLCLKTNPHLDHLQSRLHIHLQIHRCQSQTFLGDPQY